jgi:5-oxoprolinase (ATP-hydrolysing) subunit C
MSLRVSSPGTYSLLVDAGRPATRGLGIPVGGPADRWSMALGNALVGNPPFTTTLEITLTGPTLVADADVGLCVFGAPFRLDRDGEPIEPGATFTLQKGQTLHIGGTPTGCRAYVCVPGGFRATEVLGSRTGLEPVKAGEVLECEPSNLPGRSLASDEPEPEALARATARGPQPQHHADRVASALAYASGSGVRVLTGPQADWFDDAFYHHTYRVTPASNRMGLRLDGPPLVLPKRELVSEPVAPGAIQITNDGRPIVLGVDGQTIGGYPKVAHVISADLDTLGQLRPGDMMRFVRVTESDAEAAGARRRDALRQRLRRIVMALG